MPPSNQMFQWKIYSFSLWWLFYQSISCQRPRATKPCPPLFYTSFHDMWLFTFRSVDQCLIPFARNSSSSQWLFSFLFSVQNQNKPKILFQSKKRICVNNVSVIFNGSPFFSLSRFSKSKKKKVFSRDSDGQSVTISNRLNEREITIHSSVSTLLCFVLLRYFVIPNWSLFLFDFSPWLSKGNCSLRSRFIVCVCEQGWK